MTRVKICGITTRDDALLAVAAGADAIGLVFAASPRQITPEHALHIVQALPAFVLTVGVFMDQSPEHVREVMRHARLDLAQLHGTEAPEFAAALECRVIKRFSVRPDDTAASLSAAMAHYHVAGYLIDPGAGTGQTFRWEAAIGVDRPLIISGGLTPENVGACVRLLRPMAVDVASGVERTPGHKDPAKVQAFVKAAKEADVSHVAG